MNTPQRLSVYPRSPAASLQSSRPASRSFASLAMMVASGFAGLGYQIVWTQQCALWLGHEAAAVLAVVAAFFGGLACGAFAFASKIERSARPGRWYAACEFIIAAWGLVLTFVMSPVSDQLLSITGVQPTALWQWTVAFCGTFLLLLPATAAMGATLPAMERITRQLQGAGTDVASLYAANTLGAVLGVLTTAFWSVPQWGLLHTAYACIALNVLCSGVSLFLFSDNLKKRVDSASQALRPARRLTILLAFTGFLGIGYEVVVVRVLSEVAEDTVYTFAMLLAVYLIGSATGAAAYQQWLANGSEHRKTGERLLCTLAAACLVGSAALWGAAHVKAFALQTFGASMSAAMGAEALLALAAFGLPTVVMGALFSHLSTCTIAAGSNFGRALGANTLGAAAAPAIFGVVLVPMLGPKVTLLLIAAGYLLLVEPRRWMRPMVWGPVFAMLALVIWAPRLAFIDVPEGGHVVSYEEGSMAAVSVVEDADGVAVLRINNRQQEGTSATLRVDGRQAWLPLLLHPKPQRVLFLGLGTGVTASSASADPTLQVEAVELLPEVVSASRHFIEGGGEVSPHLNVIAADARRYVRTTNRRYDVIVSDNFHPARSGSASLYTVEHFTAVKQRLNDGGLFCQWLPLHQLDLATLRSIVQSFMTAYPSGWAMLASNSLETPVIGLVGRADGQRFDADALRDHLNSAPLTEMRSKFGIEDEFALLGSFIAGPEALRRFAGAAAANTDDFPIVAYQAPRITYMPDSLPRDRLIALLRELSIKPADLIASSSSGAAARLAAYWVARDRFIEAGRDVMPSRDARAMLAQVHEPLLAVLRISPDFRPAYDPLLRMAVAIARTDVSAARALLTELVTIQPGREEAALAIREIVAVNPTS